MTLYTRKGDRGETFCYAMGRRIRKDHPLIELLGGLDEANSFIGLARSYAEEENLRRDLRWIQLLLFRAGFHISGKPSIEEKDVKRLEEMSDHYFRVKLNRFILPGGGPLSSHLHVARSVVRRVERYAVKAYRLSYLKDPLVIKVLNRLSDALFAMAIYSAEELETV